MLDKNGTIEMSPSDRGNRSHGIQVQGAGLVLRRYIDLWLELIDSIR